MWPAGALTRSAPAVATLRQPINTPNGSCRFSIMRGLGKPGRAETAGGCIRERTRGRPIHLVLGAGIAHHPRLMESDSHPRAEITFEDGEVLSRLSRIHSGIQQHEQNRLRLIQDDEVASPRLRETDEVLRQLERDARSARERLSTVALRLYDGFLRNRKVPFVAHARAGLCSECNLRLPSAFGSLVHTDAALRRCPHCSRVLLREQA